MTQGRPRQYGMAGPLPVVVSHHPTRIPTVPSSHYTDLVTGAPNRQGLVRRIDSWPVARTSTLAVVVVDLDNFGAINDVIGESGGDVVLREVASRLADEAGPNAVVARIGNDEFAVAATITTAADAAELTSRLLARIHSETVESDHGATHLRASAGVAIADGAADAAQLLRHAARAQRAASVHARGSWMVHSESFEHGAATRFALAQALSRDLNGNSINLAYQPIVDLATARTVEVEALLRWSHPTLGAIPPTEVVAVAESWGLIDALGRLVLRQACRQATAWHQQRPGSDLRVAVNVSADQLRDLSFVDVAVDALVDTACDPRWLTLEITETKPLPDVALAVNILDRVRELGVHLALDDFGTYHSGINNLTRLPFDTIKVDRSYVAGPMTSDRRRWLADVCQLATDNGMQVLAEGVETEDHRQLVVECGFDLAQGWLFGRPSPPEDLNPAA